jgi:ribonuclease Z
MLSSVNIQLVNGLSGDPAVYAQIGQAGESILFDAGSLDALSNRELLKIRVVAISHTHVDHFIGFDKLIRVNVPHFRSLEIVGPSGIIQNVVGKLQGYTWNLLEPDQLTFIVHEIRPDGSLVTVKISNTNQFLPVNISSQNQPARPSVDVVDVPLVTTRFYKLSATVVDHGTDVLAFCMSLPSSRTVNKEALAESGLAPGPWIADLQGRSSNGDLSGFITVGGTEHAASALAESLLTPKPGERLLYVTDMLFSKANYARLKKLAPSGIDLLVCETNYRIRDRDKASTKSHLTTQQAALIAAALPAKQLQIFHISNIYAADVQSSVLETEACLETLRAMKPTELDATISREFEV